MPTARCEPLDAVLPTARGERGDTGVDAPYRRVVPEVPVLRQPSDGAPSGARGGGGWSAPGAAADAAVGVGSDLPQAAHQRRQPGAPGVSLSVALTIERPNQVWCADITYIPVQGGFLYLVAIMDWASRRVIVRLSNTMDTSSAWRRCGGAGKLRIPEIFNTDQGSQFTSIAFTGLRPRVYAVRWTVAVGVWTTCSSNGCGLPEVRGSIPARSGGWLRGAAGDRTVDRVLQRATTALGARRSACGSLPSVAVRRRWRSEQNGRRPAWGARASEGAGSASVGTQARSPPPRPQRHRRLISTRKGGDGIHLLIPASLSNRSGPPHG